MALPANKNLRPFQRVLGISDFGITADKTLVAGEYSKIGTYTVGAQQEATFGISVLRSGGVEGEPVYLSMHDAASIASTSQIEGTVRFELANATESVKVLVYEQRTERLRASQNDRTLAPLLMEFGRNAREDSKLLLSVQIDGSSDKTWDYDGTNSKFLIPVTIYQ